MNRREFLARAATALASGLAVDQLDLLDRLGWTRRWFAGWTAPLTSPPITVTAAEWDALLKDVYCEPLLLPLNIETPFLAKLRRPGIIAPRRVIYPVSR